MELWVRFTNQDTAAAETALCDEHFADKASRDEFGQSAEPDVTGPYGKVDNPELACMVCGKK